jgi:hypothetical protein
VAILSILGLLQLLEEMQTAICCVLAINLNSMLHLASIRDGLQANKSISCGAGNRLSVYKLNNTVPSITSSSSAAPSPTGPVHVKSVGSYNWQGCYTEATGIRALNSASLVNATGMTGQFFRAQKSCD